MSQFVWYIGYKNRSRYRTNLSQNIESYQSIDSFKLMIGHLGRCVCALLDDKEYIAQVVYWSMVNALVRLDILA